MRPVPRSRGAFLMVVRDADFRTLWSAATLSEASRRLELFVLSWFTLQATDSPFQLALVLVFNNLPKTLFSLFAGTLSERLNRGHILVASQVLNVLIAGVILALIATDRMEAWHAFVAVFLQGGIRSLEDTARRMAVYDIVGGQRLVNAVSLEVMSVTSGRLIGPLLGGALLVYWDFTVAFGWAVGIHVMSLLLLTRVTFPLQRALLSAEPVLRGLKVAARHVLYARIFLGLVSVSVVMNAMAFPAAQLIPSIGRDHLGVGPGLVGLLVAAEGMGNILSSAIIAAVGPSRSHGRLYVLGSLVVLTMFILFAWSPWYGLSFALMASAGIGQAGFSTMQWSMNMLYAPQEMRGRILGLQNLFIGLGGSLGLLQMGAIALLIGTRWAVASSATAGLLLLIPVVALTPLVWPASTQRGLEASGD